MKIRLVAVGKRMPAWVDQGVQEYLSRFPATIQLTLSEIPLTQRGKKPSDAAIRDAVVGEGKKILSLIDHRDRVIALDITGVSWTTLCLSKQLDSWRAESRDTVLLVGGPDGLSKNCLQRANAIWSLSPLTLPHPLVRVLLVEQLYRAWTILQNHPYHK